ncbi:MAG TPA: TIGR02444 family protein [Stellaceae bacterium]|nr:TIGR02444 family protein [Stellaceae bacterium]
MTDASDAFWRFALALYARPGVAPACLELQDRHGKDVIIALFGCWLGASARGRLDPAALARAEDTAGPWRRQVVEPLRRTRHALKGIVGAEALYGRMKEIELDAERSAILRLAPLAAAPDPGATAEQRLADARANLALYVGAAGVGAAAPIMAALGDMGEAV